mgnify:CR=1 FL=1
MRRLVPRSLQGRLLLLVLGLSRLTDKSYYQTAPPRRPVSPCASQVLLYVFVCTNFESLISTL